MVWKTQFPNHLGNKYIDIQQLFQWMKHSGLCETEGLITAAQDQALNIRYYNKHIMKEGHTDRCRMWHSQLEIVEHIISGCQTLATDQYLNRNSQVAVQIHLDICKHYEIKVDAKSWYEHKPNRVTKNEQVTKLQNSKIITDRHIPQNKPDIVIKEKETGMCLIIDVALPSEYNIHRKATEKMTKYVDFQTECQRRQ